MLLPPRVDRHTHLEGSLAPDWVRLEAARRHLSVPDLTEAFWRGEAHSFEAFIATFVFACGFLTSSEAVAVALGAAVKRLPPPRARPPPGHRSLDLPPLAREGAQADQPGTPVEGA